MGNSALSTTTTARVAPDPAQRKLSPQQRHRNQLKLDELTKIMLHQTSRTSLLRPVARNQGQARPTAPPLQIPDGKQQQDHRDAKIRFTAQTKLSPAGKVRHPKRIAETDLNLEIHIRRILQSNDNKFPVGSPPDLYDMCQDITRQVERHDKKQYAERVYLQSRKESVILVPSGMALAVLRYLMTIPEPTTTLTLESIVASVRRMPSDRRSVHSGLMDPAEVERLAVQNLMDMGELQTRLYVRYLTQWILDTVRSDSASFSILPNLEEPLGQNTSDPSQMVNTVYDYLSRSSVGPYQASRQQSTTRVQKRQQVVRMLVPVQKMNQGIDAFKLSK